MTRKEVKTMATILPKNEEIPEVEVHGEDAVIRVKEPVIHDDGHYTKEPQERKVKLPKTKWA